MVIKFSLVIVVVSLLCCGDHGNIDNPFPSRATDTTVIDIPTLSDGSPTTGYTLIKRLEDKLQLSSIENGVDSLEMRIWLLLNEDTTQLIIIKYEKKKWQGQFTTFSVFSNSADAAQIVKNVESKVPLHGWNNLVARITKDSLMELTDELQLQDYKLATGGEWILFEFSRPKFYRFVNYPLPQLNMDLRDVKKAVDFVNFLESEFQFQKTTGLGFDIEKHKHQVSLAYD